MIEALVALGVPIVLVIIGASFALFVGHGGPPPPPPE